MGIKRYQIKPQSIKMDCGFYWVFYNQKYKYVRISDICMNTREKICSNNSDFSVDKYLENYNDEILYGKNVLL